MVWDTSPAGGVAGATHAPPGDGVRPQWQQTAGGRWSAGQAMGIVGTVIGWTLSRPGQTGYAVAGGFGRRATRAGPVSAAVGGAGGVPDAGPAPRQWKGGR